MRCALNRITWQRVVFFKTTPIDSPSKIMQKMYGLLRECYRKIWSYLAGKFWKFMIRRTVHARYCVYYWLKYMLYSSSIQLLLFYTYAQKHIQNTVWSLYLFSLHVSTIQWEFQLSSVYFVKGALYSPIIWLPMKFNLYYNLQMVLANVLYFFTGYKLTLVHSLVQTQLLNLL